MSGLDDVGYTVAIEDEPDVAEVAALEDAVVAAVVAAAGGTPETEFGVFVRDPRGRMVAGIAGSLWGGCCHLQSMWVDESLRGRGWARRLMLSVEAEARRRGCVQVMFLAYDLVLPGFYHRLGYETVAVLEDCPRGSALRWYRKHLSGAHVGPIAGAGDSAGSASQ